MKVYPEQEAQDGSADYQKLLHGKEAAKNSIITKNAEDVGSKGAVWT